MEQKSPWHITMYLKSSLSRCFFKQNLKIRLQLFPFFAPKFKPFSTEVESIEGYEGKILEVLSHYLNFKFRLLDCNDTWGIKQDDGSFDGIVGAVVNGVNLKSKSNQC